MNVSRRTRRIRIGRQSVGGDAPVVVQSMCATKTRDIDATVAQTQAAAAAGAGVVRIAVDNEKEVEALKEIRRQTDAVLAVDLQENYRLAATVGPYVDKIRYNPGHLHHVERDKSIARQGRAGWRASPATPTAPSASASTAARWRRSSSSAIPDDQLEAIVQSALYHCALMDELGFDRFVVSLKDSDPQQGGRRQPRFAAARPDVPLHLGVTEAGMPPEGIIKTRLAFETAARARHRRHHPRLADAPERAQARRGRGRPQHHRRRRRTAASSRCPTSAAGLNIISCPSCSRVENESFVELAQQVRELTRVRAAAPHHHRRHGLPGERPGRDRRRRPRPVVRPVDGEPEAEGREDRQPSATPRCCRGSARSSID